MVKANWDSRTWEPTEDSSLSFFLSEKEEMIDISRDFLQVCLVMIIKIRTATAAGTEPGKSSCARKASVYIPLGDVPQLSQER